MKEVDRLEQELAILDERVKQAENRRDREQLYCAMWDKANLIYADLLSERKQLATRIEWLFLD
jgi:hypothetical protein